MCSHDVAHNVRESRPPSLQLCPFVGCFWIHTFTFLESLQKTVFRIWLLQTDDSTLWRTKWGPGLKFPLFTCTLCPICYRCTPNDSDLEECTHRSRFGWALFWTFLFEKKIFCILQQQGQKKKLLTWIQNDMKTLGKENVVPTAVDVLISAFKDLYICRREVGTCTAKMDTLTCTQRPMNDNAPGLWCFTTHSFLWPRPIDRPGYCGQKTEAL